MEELLEILKSVIKNCDVEKEDDFIGHGLLDSLSIMQLVVKLNDEFDIEITPVDMVPENFKSAQAIYDMVKRLED